MPTFIWDERNEAHIGEHNISRREAEYVVSRARNPYPEYMGHAKYLVRGQTEDGYYVQVIFMLLEDVGGIDASEIDLIAAAEPEALYVIHARPLMEKEIRLFRRRMQ